TRFSRDWSSDVCSSDLGSALARQTGHEPARPAHCGLQGRSFPADRSGRPPRFPGTHVTRNATLRLITLAAIAAVASAEPAVAQEIGRASCRERAWVAAG